MKLSAPVLHTSTSQHPSLCPDPVWSLFGTRCERPVGEQIPSFAPAFYTSRACDEQTRWAPEVPGPSWGLALRGVKKGKAVKYLVKLLFKSWNLLVNCMLMTWLSKIQNRLIFFFAMCLQKYIKRTWVTINTSNYQIKICAVKCLSISDIILRQV